MRESARQGVARQGRGKLRTALLLALMAAGMFAYTLWYGGR